MSWYNVSKNKKKYSENCLVFALNAFFFETTHGDIRVKTMGGQGCQTWGFPPDLGFSDVVWGYGVIRLNLGFSPKNIENLNQILQRIFRNIDS